MFNWKIIYLSNIEKVWEKQYEKRTVVVEEQKDDYPQKLVGTLFGKKVQEFSNLSVWDEVEVEYNLAWSENKGKWYGNINIWMIKKTGGTTKNEDMDDLPFN